MNEIIPKLNKREFISEGAEKIIRNIRRIFESYDLKVLFDGSRARGTAVGNSDFDLKIVKKIESNLSKDEIIDIFQKHHQFINEIIKENFPQAKTEDGEK
jgi:tRNA nucleotidyltransferase (CCA-adding enzyme)